MTPVQTSRRTYLEPTGSPSRSVAKAGTRRSARRAPHRDPRWARALVTCGALLMVLSGGAIVGGKMLIGQATGSIGQGNLLGSAGKTEAEGGRNLDGPIDMLLLGVDKRPDWKVEDTRADTIIILHIPASHDQAYLLSIPRDTEVQVPAFDQSGYPGGTAKATEVFYHGAQKGAGWAGGAQLMAQTIKNMTGIGFDGAAIIDFNGLRGVIDALGSVRMCVDQQVTSHHLAWVDGKLRSIPDAKKAGEEWSPVVHKVGCREMKGWEALDFARQRYNLKNGDYDRQRHQQQLIKAMARKAMDGGVVSNPLTVKRLIDAAGKAFILDTGDVPIADFIFTLRGVTANDLVLLRTNNGTFSGVGNGREALKPLSLEMFAAVRSDNLADFVINHPEVLAPSGN